MTSRINSSFDSEADSDFFNEDESCQNQNTTKSKDEIQENQINKIINSIAEILINVSGVNNSLPAQNEFKKKYPVLFSEKTPKISLYDYISRIQKYSFCEKNTLILSLIYIDRFCELSNINLTNNNIHRIFFISNLIAIKYNEDSIYSNKYYSEIAGISFEELNLMENYFLKLIDFNLFVSKDEFKKYEEHLDSFEDSTTSNSDI